MSSRWQSKPRIPLRGRVMNLLGEARALVRKERYLDRDAVLDFAYRDTGLSDLGPTFEPELLDLLLQSAEEDADFTFLGRRAFHDSVGTTLAIRLFYIEARKRHPEIFARPLRPPMLIMGYPRTGTTLLHNLLALHEGYRVVPNWELRRPVPPWALDRGGADARLEIAERAFRERARYSRSTDHIHFQRPDTPGECITLMLITFRSAAFWQMGPLYSYVDALLRDDGREKYREYVELLKLLQSARPDHGLLLKAPEHTAFLDRIVEALPGVAIIQTHRDPVKSAVSLMSLFRANHGNVAKRVDVSRLAEMSLAMLERGFSRNLEAREAHEVRVFDVFYDALVSDPVGIVRQIYERFDVAWPQGHERRLASYLAKHPRGKHGRHDYHAAEFGLTDDAIRRRLSGYIEYFGLQGGG